MMLDFRQSYCIQTDASFHGIGAVSPDDWFAGSWAAFPADAANSRLFPSHFCFAGRAIDPSLRSNINFLRGAFNNSRFLSPPAAGVLFGQTNVFA